MKKILVLALALSLGACATTTPPAPIQTVTVTRLEVIAPDMKMYQCPIVQTFPAWQTLTDLQTAKLLEQLFRNNQICYNSIQTIKKFVSTSKKRVER